MHNNISIFIPHLGCPHKCAFCSQSKISGHDIPPTFDEVQKICQEQLGRIKNPENTEIAFFGGSFTAIPHDMMTGYLECVSDFVGNGKFAGIRMSTRPDAIDDDIIETLKKYNVTSIELGAQSMDDRVLELNERGHTAEDVVNAANKIRNAGIELGLQMMTGLYGSNRESDLETMRKIAELKPETVRIYPTVVIKDTRLADYLESGEYKPMTFEDMTNLCSEMLEYFAKQGIKVIKCGLHAEKSLEENIVGGYYHPAFREICESLVYRRKMERLITESHKPYREYTFEIGKGCTSKAKGQKKSNEKYFKEKNINIKTEESSSIKELYGCRLRQGG